MTQPIDRETAIALVKEAGKDTDFTKHIELWTPDTWRFTERLCNLAVAHSRKDAEPVAEVNSAHGDPERFGERRVDVLLSDKAMLKVPYGTKLYAHPPEADKLLQQALEALEYRLQQTRPIHQADSVMEAIRTYLENKNA